MKRFFLSCLVGLVTLTPSILSSEEKLQSDINVHAIVSNIGDVTISWNTAPIQQLTDSRLQIGYSYDKQDHPGSFKPTTLDPSQGYATFTNLSLDSAYTFSFALTSADGQAIKQKLEVQTPKPVRLASGNSAIDAQMAYVDAHWQTRKNPYYMYIASNDCANFVSQSLLARGLTPDSRWHQTDMVPTRAFVSATSMKSYLKSLPGVHELTDGQRDQVKLGDVVMFDWNRSGDVDHVGIVDYIERLADGRVKIYFAQHTLHRSFRSVDWVTSIVHPNAFVSYLSIPQVLDPFTLSSLFTRTTGVASSGE